MANFLGEARSQSSATTFVSWLDWLFFPALRTIRPGQMSRFHDKWQAGCYDTLHKGAQAMKIRILLQDRLDERGLSQRKLHELTGIRLQTINEYTAPIWIALSR